MAQVPWSLPKSAQIPLLAIVYFVAGKLGLILALVHASATAVWAPTGIALAAFILLGYRVWPAIFAGAFLVNITTPAGSFASNISSPSIVATTLGIAAGNTLEGLTGAWLVNRFANGRNAFDHVRNVIRFAVLAGLGCTMVSATVGVLSLCLGGLAQWTNFGAIWLTWWMGDMGGALVVAPLLVLVGRNPRVNSVLAQGAEPVALFASAILITQMVFLDAFAPRGAHSPLSFLCIPPLIWAAFRFGPRETAAVLVIISGIAVLGTLLGYGPFVHPSGNESLLMLQAF
ncbi:MAG: MASE1 domain-containing protein, partial [Verrucomicrobia bacterium]|nr:MASE1 domain-containing protein [Verrucomicrobiota bacterium]